MALSPWLWALPVLLVPAGLSMSISNTSASALLQATAHSGLRGQTISLSMLALRGGVSVGGLLTGVSGHLLGVRHALLIDGALALAAQAGVGRRRIRTRLPGAVP